MKRTLLAFLLLLGLLWLLPGCRKDEPRKTILHGRVTEYGTNKAIADARIYVGCEESVPFGPSSFTLVDSLITDADGKFYKEYAEADLCSNSSLIPYKKGYFKGTPLYPTTDNKAFEVVMDPEAWLKIMTIPDGVHGYDHIGIGGDFSFEVWAFLGAKDFDFTTRGNRTKIVGWGPFSAPSIIFRDTIYVSAHDTTLYTIHY